MQEQVIVIGLGCVGSAVCANISKRGAKVIGLEQYTIGHEKGSSAHQSRAFRMAYAEHPGYVPLLQRSRELWMELNETYSDRVFHATGGLYLSRAGSGFVPDSIASAVKHDVPHEVMDFDGVRSRWPIFELTHEMIGLYEPLAGVIVPEHAIAAYIAMARNHDADLREGVTVLGWNTSDSGIEVETNQGTVRGDRLVICAGAWASKIAQTDALHVQPSRQLLIWFDAPASANVDAPDLPVWAVELDDTSLLYGFPRMKGLPGPHGFKVARHWVGPAINPDDDHAKEVVDGDASEVKELLARWLPQAVGPVLAVRTCMYSNSNSGHFRIGHHPESDRVTIIAGLSGHGFKFQPVLGEIGADLAICGSTEHNIDFLSLTGE